MSYRKENKYKVSTYDALIAKEKLFSQGMSRLYPNRLITSQYFDTNDSRMFFESEEGLLPRKKFRVRWYNGSIAKMYFEEKISSIEGRFKKTHLINHDNFLKLVSNGFVQGNYGNIFPSVKIVYRRDYFSFKGLRFTFDTNISYHFSNKNIVYNDPDQVIEIKAPVACSDEYIDSVFPAPKSRFSKYSRAFLMRLGHI